MTASISFVGVTFLLPFSFFCRCFCCRFVLVLFFLIFEAESCRVGSSSLELLLSSYWDYRPMPSLVASFCDNRTPEAECLYKEKMYLSHISGDSRVWLQQLLRSGKDTVDHGS